MSDQISPELRKYTDEKDKNDPDPVKRFAAEFRKEKKSFFYRARGSLQGELNIRFFIRGQAYLLGIINSEAAEALRILEITKDHERGRVSLEKIPALISVYHRLSVEFFYLFEPFILTFEDFQPIDNCDWVFLFNELSKFTEEMIRSLEPEEINATDAIIKKIVETKNLELFAKFVKQATCGKIIIS